MTGRMRGLRWVCALGCLASLQACGMSDAKVHAEPGVAAFHEQLDAADYDGIWNGAHEDFRKASGKEAYQKFVEAVHRKLGNVKSTKNAGWQVNNYNFVTRVVLQQHTVIERGAGERVGEVGAVG